TSAPPIATSSIPCDACARPVAPARSASTAHNSPRLADRLALRQHLRRSAPPIRNHLLRQAHADQPAQDRTKAHAAPQTTLRDPRDEAAPASMQTGRAPPAARPEA